MYSKYEKKNMELSLKFDRYAMKNLELYDQIPNGSWVVMTDANDPQFSAQSLAILRKHKIKKAVEIRREKRGWKVVPLAAPK